MHHSLGLLEGLLFFLLFRQAFALPVSRDNGETLLDLTVKDTNGSASSTTEEEEDSFARACRTKTLCPEGIANIVVGGLMFGFLGCFACAMWQWEAHAERRARINIALARNREIDRQIEAARQHQAPPPSHPHSVPLVTDMALVEESKTTGRGLRKEETEDKAALLTTVESSITHQ